MTDATVQSTPGTGQGGGQLPPLTNPYTTVHGDTLPSLAERAGHPGEWLAIAELNRGAWHDYNSPPPGLPLELPAEWGLPTLADTKPADGGSGGGVVPASSMSAAELISLAGSAQTLAELDAIDAAAAGRVTVADAVDARRQTLLDQGVAA